MKILIISKNNENFRYAYKLLNVNEEDIDYGREVKDVEKYSRNQHYQDIIIDLPYPTDYEIRLCSKFKDQNKKVKIMIFALEMSRQDKTTLIKEDFDVYITDPSCIYIEKLAAFSEILGTANEIKEEKILIDKYVIFDLKGWKIIKNGEDILLPEKEYRLLSLFATNKDRVFTTEELLINIWDEQTEKERVRNYIKKLRNKIGDNGSSPKLLVHKSGAGYYLKTIV